MNDTDAMDAIARTLAKEGANTRLATIGMIVGFTGRDVPELPRTADDLANKLEEFLWPERFPLGHERHDPNHVYWMSGEPDRSCYQWDSATMECVAGIIERDLQRAGCS